GGAIRPLFMVFLPTKGSGLNEKRLLLRFAVTCWAPPRPGFLPGCGGGAAAEQAPLYRIPPAVNNHGGRQPPSAVEPSLLGCGTSRPTAYSEAMVGGAALSLDWEKNLFYPSGPDG